MDKQQIIKQVKDYLGINALTKEVQIYLDFKKEVVKTSIVDGSAKTIHGVIKGVGFAFLGLCIFLFFNLMLGFGISEWFFRGKYWTGFSILTGFYLLLALIFAALQSMIKQKVEEKVMEGIQGTPLELVSINKLTYPELKQKEEEELKAIQKNNSTDTTEQNTSQEPEDKN